MNEENKNIPNEKTDANAETSKEQNELQKCQNEREEYLNGWKRAVADFANYKKDEAKRRAEIIKFANEEIISDFLPILDSFDLALAVSPSSESENQIKKGIAMIKMQLMESLKKYGLEEISPHGKKFDPACHEAVAETDYDKESGTIVEIVSKGYILNNKVIRAAKVKVAK